MLYKGIFITAASGKIDGAVASHNRGGPYFRALTIPTDPDTAEQEALRLAMAQLADAWAGDLTPAQREAWQRFAMSHTYPNRIADQRHLTGRMEYFRANLPRLQVLNWLGDALPRVDDPSPLGPSFPPDDGAYIEIGNPSSAEFDIWWDADNHPWSDQYDALLVYISGPQRQTVNYFRSPYTLVAAIHGDLSPSYNVAVAALAPLVTPARYFWRMRITTHDGRLSAPFHGHLDT